MDGHGTTCANSHSFGSGIHCDIGYWGCIVNCCEDTQGTEEPSIPPINGNSPGIIIPDAPAAIGAVPAAVPVHAAIPVPAAIAIAGMVPPAAYVPPVSGAIPVPVLKT